MNEELIGRFMRLYRNWSQAEEAATKKYEAVKKTPAYKEYLRAREYATREWERKSPVEKLLYEKLTPEEFDEVWETADGY